MATKSASPITFAKHLRALRMSLGISRYELAKRAKTDSAAISKMENGKTSHPKLGMLIRLARALGTTIDRLIPENLEE